MNFLLRLMLTFGAWLLPPGLALIAAPPLGFMLSPVFGVDVPPVHVLAAILIGWLITLLAVALLLLGDEGEEQFAWSDDESGFDSEDDDLGELWPDDLRVRRGEFGAARIDPDLEREVTRIARAMGFERAAAPPADRDHSIMRSGRFMSNAAARRV